MDYAAKAHFLPDRHLSILRDITDRKKAARRWDAEHAVTRVLAESASFDEAGPRLLRAIAESLDWPLGVIWQMEKAGNRLRCAYCWSVPSTAMADAQKIFEQITFATGSGLAGRAWAGGEPICTTDICEGADALPASLASWNARATVAFPIRAADQVLAVMQFLHPAGDPCDTDLLQTVQAIGSQIGQFISRRSAEQERSEFLMRERAARAEAEKANQVKDQFLATVSHELRTPLTAILGYARLLQSRRLDEASFSLALEAIERNARQQTRLIEDLMDHSRITSGKLRLEVRPTDLTQATQAAVDMVRAGMEGKGIRFVAEIGSDPIPMRGDPDRLQQIVSNLLSNAMKFTPEGGTVEIHLERAPSGARLIVKDSGIGIHPEFLPHVFEAFRQAEAFSKRGSGGLGLGLALVRRLVELHGGTVQAESAGKGQGATFTVSFPPGDAGVVDLNVAVGAGEREEQAEPAVLYPVKPIGRESGGNNRVSLRGIRILAVDDHADTRCFLTAALQQLGAEVTTVDSAKEALATFTRLRPDVLVSDIAMPGEDGYSLIRKVRALGAARGGDIPAIALTAHVGVSDQAWVLKTGYNMHLPKPIEPAELAAAIAGLLRGLTTQVDDRG